MPESTDIGISDWLALNPTGVIHALGLPNPSWPFFSSESGSLPPRWHQMIGAGELVKRAFRPSADENGRSSQLVVDTVGLGKTCQQITMICYLRHLHHRQSLQIASPPMLRRYLVVSSIILINCLQKTCHILSESVTPASFPACRISLSVRQVSYVIGKVRYSNGLNFVMDQRSKSWW